MSYTTVASVVSGNPVTATWGNSVATAMGELQTGFPQTYSTWSSPINAGITVGNGTQTANYYQAGKLVHCVYRLVLGTTSTIGAAVLNLPVTALTTGVVMVRGTYVDTGTATYDVMGASSSGTVALSVPNASATYVTATAISSTIPFTWTSTDVMNVELLYMAL